ncbi:MAG: excalibur calcium-binding domain-containing protein [Sporichthyaceae bacterium]
MEASAQAATGTYANCTALNKKYKHGVAKKGARDLIGGKYVKGKSVTTFKVSSTIYAAAIKANKRLDGDKDGVACEKR